MTNERKTIIGVAARLLGAVMVLGVYCVVFFNPFGLAQLLFAGQRPPFHWVRSQDGAAGDVLEDYVGVNGAVCASVYRYAALSAAYKVYGFGFSYSTIDTRTRAEHLAEKECR